MAEQPARKRRIVRRTLMALAVVVLLLWLYIGGAVLLLAGLGAQILPNHLTSAIMDVYCYPLWWYAEQEWFWSEECFSLLEWSIDFGVRFSSR